LIQRKGDNSSPAGADRVGLVRVGPLAALPGLVRELGADPDLLIRGVGLRPDQFADPDTEIPFIVASRLLAQAVSATGCEHLGLTLGTRSPLSSLGLPGFMLRNAPDVGSALRTLIRHLSLHDEGGEPIVQLRGSVVQLGYLVHQAGAEATDQIYDLSAAICCNLMREICGPNWHPVQVLLPRRALVDMTPYKQFFRAPVRFNANEMAVIFESKWLDQPVSGADPLLYRHLEREAAERHQTRQRDLVSQLRWTLRRLLLEQRSSSERVARELHLHPRQLDRRLKAAGTSYRKELEAIRFEMARQFLVDTDMPIAKIARSLDYADTTTFARAFKRWSGVAPSAWRSNLNR
jgi:AraC-like DNA-binding protein